MTEIWLHSNRRILLLAMVPVAFLAGLGLLCLRSQWMAVSSFLGVFLLVLALLLMFGLVRQIFRPRIAYRNGHVLFSLTSGAPIAVPLQVVEAFFQGEGPAHLPGQPGPGSGQPTKTVNLVARLSQGETDWLQREVKSALGRWEEGYITIRGTWCEPITGEVIRRLNRRLSEVRREQKSQAEGVADV